jgi:putative acetyltransferase
MQSLFRIREATAADAPRVREIIFAALLEHGLEPDPGGTDADLYELEAYYGQPGRRFDVLVEEATGAVIGSVALVPVDAGEAELRKMYLAAEHRRRGLGRAMLGHALHVARELGYRRVRLETATCLDAAIRLYEQYGFERLDCGAHAGRCDVVMARDLD